MELGLRGVELSIRLRCKHRCLRDQAVLQLLQVRGVPLARPFLRQLEDLQRVRLRNGSPAAERSGVDVPGVPNHARPRRERSDQPETKYRGLHGNQRLGTGRLWLGWHSKRNRPGRTRNFAVGEYSFSLTTKIAARNEKTVHMIV